MRHPLPVLGNVNANIASEVLFRGQIRTTDMGVVGMTRVLIEMGAVPGDRFLCEAGGRILSRRRPGTIMPDVCAYVLTAEGGAERTPNGWWSDRLRGASGWMNGEEARETYPELFELG